MGALSTAVTANGDSAFVRFTGALDENSDLSGSLFGPYKSVTLDLAEVARITSQGVRQWLLWIARLDRTKTYNIVKAPRIFVAQANLIQGMIPEWMTVQSIELPFYCEPCDNAFGHVMETRRDQDPTALIPQMNCPKCNNPVELDAIPEKYLQFLKPKSAGK